jgi:lysozyme family protein
MQIDEKGKDDDPVDRGGRTCDGVTQSEFDAWCTIHSQPKGDVWNIDEATKQALFHNQYWFPWCDRLPNAMDYLWFDANVNSGPHEATLLFQRALGFTGRMLDGHMGIVTVTAAAGINDLAGFVDRFVAEHKRVYNEIIAKWPLDEKYKNGWYNRLGHEHANAMEMLREPTKR